MKRGRKKIKQNSIKIVISTVLVIIIFFLSRAIWNIYQKNSLARENKNAYETKLLKLEERYNSLSADLLRLQTEQGLEEEIRSKFQVAKPGEHTIVFFDKKIDNDDKKPTKGFWKSLIDFFR